VDRRSHLDAGRNVQEDATGEHRRVESREFAFLDGNLLAEVALDEIRVLADRRAQVGEDDPGVAPLGIESESGGLRILLNQQSGHRLAAGADLCGQRHGSGQLERFRLGSIRDQRLDVVDEELLGLRVAPQMQHSVGKRRALVTFPGGEAPILQPLGLFAGLGDAAGGIRPNR